MTDEISAGQGAGTHRSESLRVVLVTHYYPSHRGGIEIVAGQLASRLAADGHHRICWFASNTDEQPEAQPALRCISVPSTNVIERWLRLPYPLWSPSVVGRMWRSIKTADVVHLHDFPYCGSLLSFCLARIQRRPVLLTQHVGVIPYDSRILRLLQKIVVRVIGSFMMRRMDRVVFVSDAVRREFCRFVRFRQPPRLVFNGVDSAIYSPVEAQVRQTLRTSFGIAEGVPALVFVGRFVEKKGLAILRELARHVRSVVWLFAGAGPLDPERWGLQNVVVFRNLTGRRLADLYRAADLLVLPSKGEGFPLVVQESMACGTPALISSETVTAVPRLSECCHSESVSGADVTARWQATIERLLRRPDQLCAMRRTVADFARSNWSWEKCLDAYVEMLEELKSATTSPALTRTYKHFWAE